MIAREMLDRGLIRRMLVLCPALYATNRPKELSEKFGLRPAVIQPANFARLEREVPRADVPVYQHYPCMVASIDFVKSDRHKPMLVANAPELVIVDEAHLATRPRGVDPTAPPDGRAPNWCVRWPPEPERHLVLVTATPHSGIEENFRSLLGLLNPAFDISIRAVRTTPRRARRCCPISCSAAAPKSRNQSRVPIRPFRSATRLTSPIRFQKPTRNCSAPCSTIAAARSRRRRGCGPLSSGCGIGRQSPSSARCSPAPKPQSRRWSGEKRRPSRRRKPTNPKPMPFTGRTSMMTFTPTRAPISRPRRHWTTPPPNGLTATAAAAPNSRPQSARHHGGRS